jgi:eukaryotic-like serine/threonine-protein kinase
MMSASTLPASIASRYLPVRLIGKGGMGVVYEVVHARTGEHLALKVLQGSAGAPTEALERFKREARAPALLKSENVVHVSDADVAPELDDAPFLVMELLEGMDLERAASLSKPDPATVVGWLRQIAPALDKAHRLGIIHRDLKPENLFLATVEDRPPVVKILDFGIAKMAEEGTAPTVSGQVLGTPKYMAPEQAARHPQVTPATDRYALGLVAYRLIVGESYYRGAVMSILAELLHGPLSPPSARNPSLGAAFDAWFLQACDREPERRFASASIQVEALAEALGLPSGPGDVVRGPETSTRIRGPKIRRTLAAGALLLATAVVVFSYRGSHRGQNRSSGAVIEPPVVREQPAVAAGSAPKTVPETARITAPETVASSAPAGTGSPAVSPRSNSALVKTRPRTSSSGTVTAPPAARNLDPFKDQK